MTLDKAWWWWSIRSTITKTLDSQVSRSSLVWCNSQVAYPQRFFAFCSHQLKQTHWIPLSSLLHSAPLPMLITSTQQHCQALIHLSKSQRLSPSTFIRVIPRPRIVLAGSNSSASFTNLFAFCTCHGSSTGDLTCLSSVDTLTVQLGATIQNVHRLVQNDDH